MICWFYQGFLPSLRLSIARFPLNFWVWHKLSFTKSTNQQENALLILRDLEETPDKINKSTVICNLLLWIFWSIKSSILKINKSTAKRTINTQTLKKKQYKINKSTVICNQFLWIFGSDTLCHLQNQEINRKARYLSSETMNNPTNQQKL